jgi:hypothetical protein
VRGLNAASQTTKKEEEGPSSTTSLYWGEGGSRESLDSRWGQPRGWRREDEEGGEREGNNFLAVHVPVDTRLVECLPSLDLRVVLQWVRFFFLNYFVAFFLK